MASGFSGGGISSRSIDNSNSTPKPTYRSQNQFPGVFPETSPPLHPHLRQQQQPPPQTLIGKRALMDFLSQQQQQQHRQVQNPALNNLWMRYVKPRIQRQGSQISPLHSLDFPAAAPSSLPDVMSLSGLSNTGVQPTHGCGVPLLQQIRNEMVQPGTTVATALPGFPLTNASQNRTILPENDNGVMNRLQELEKQLLDNEEAVDGNATSVITNGNSEWSDALQSLMVVTRQCQKQISPSPTSSSSSSSPSSSLSVASPVTTCSRQTILEAASAIYEGKGNVAVEILARITALANPKDNWEQKLMDYMLFALKSRLNPAENSPQVAELFSEEHALSRYHISFHYCGIMIR